MYVTFFFTYFSDTGMAAAIPYVRDDMIRTVNSTAAGCRCTYTISNIECECECGMWDVGFYVHLFYNCSSCY